MALKIPFNAVQKALYELLSKGQTVPVTEHIPTGQEEFPYIWIGASNDVPENGIKMDLLPIMEKLFYILKYNRRLNNAYN